MNDATEKKSRAAFVIPNYNHGQTVLSVVQQAQQTGLPVVVVDDGSTDGGTEKLMEYQGIHLIRHESNQGKGAALKSGFHAARELAEFAITIDSDGQHDPQDGLRLLASVTENERPFIVGKREGMLDDPRIPWTSRFGRKFSNFWVRLSGGPKLSDTQSGLRLYPIEETLSLHTHARHYNYEVEVLALANWRGYPIREVPVSVEYFGKVQRISHFKPFTDFWRNGGVFIPLMLLSFLLPKSLRRRWF